ncbi:FAD binding domain-containing protein [Phytohabitans suffuscus]|uniref:Carbon monoxide dehydrogenase medium subunit n=1 Tax=Phytohabitans suffuscus TaxID=624315 RepID=A0A6F8YZ87_9ACTN|nr:xanthine dehydrogenase family protein subunit M [Phytohabitans suffuscus]BCB91485.1 carbon monoxide dehydrogenase medium subunit [Phytohabitans suffuscus]
MQVPAHFEYERATSVDHALALLAKWGSEARVVAGGHSLIPMMKLRLARPEALVDINDLEELAYVRLDGDALAVGAMTRHADLLASPLVGEHYPIFHEAERVIADPVVRNRGTVGGSLCQADPSEDLSAAFAAVGAAAVIRGPDGTRQVPVREFHTGPYETVVAPGELLVEVVVPVRPGGWRDPVQGAQRRDRFEAATGGISERSERGWQGPGGGSAYEKVERRVGDWAVAAAGAAVWLDGDTIGDAGIGLTAVGAAHFHAPEAERFLRGSPATDAVLAEAGRIAAEHCEPVADQRGPADYKKHLAGELTTRALARAVKRARGEA